MSNPHFVVVFRGDEILEAAHNNEFRPLKEIPTGDCVVVNCEIALLGGNRYGISKVQVRRVAVSRSATFDDLCFLHEKTPHGLSVERSSTDALTAKQRKKTIEAINKEDHYWWENAPREVKLALQAGYSKEDEAREFVSQGVDRFSRGDLTEAARLIQKG